MLEYEHFAKHYKLIAIDLSEQIELENPDLKQQISFIDRLDGDNGGTMFSTAKKPEEKTFEFLQNALIVCLISLVIRHIKWNFKSM